MTKAFLAGKGGQGAASAQSRSLVEEMPASVVQAMVRSRQGGGTFHIEDIQDHVELALMRSGEHEVARAYVLYREKRNQERAAQRSQEGAVAELGQQAVTINVNDHGTVAPLNIQALSSRIESACVNLGEAVSAEPILGETIKNLYDGVSLDEVYKSAILSSRALIEKEPGYTQATARLLLHTVRREVLGEEVVHEEMAERYGEYFPRYIRTGIEAGLLDSKLQQFDLKRLADAIEADRDLQFSYLGLQTLYDRYFLHISERRIELPQIFFMRVAICLLYTSPSPRDRTRSRMPSSA